MAGSINKVILVGNLGRDPEVRSMQDGGKIVQLSLATSETWKDRSSGERRERTEWHRVVIFNEALGNIAEQYLRKGSTVYIEGQLQTRKWGEPGQEKYTTEVVLQRYRGELTMLVTGKIKAQLEITSRKILVLMQVHLKIWLRILMTPGSKFEDLDDENTVLKKRFFRN